MSFLQGKREVLLFPIAFQDEVEHVSRCGVPALGHQYPAQVRFGVLRSHYLQTFGSSGAARDFIKPSTQGASQIHPDTETSKVPVPL